MKNRWTRWNRRKINCWKYTFVLFLFLVLLIYVTVELYRYRTVPASNQVFILDRSGDSWDWKDNEDQRDFDRFKGNWVTWGWTYYANEQDFVKRKPPNPQYRLEGLETISGLWVPRTLNNSIQLFNFQGDIPLPVAIGIRLYMIGQVGLEIQFSDSSRTNTEVMKVMLDKNSILLHGFCNKIIVDNLPSFSQNNVFINDIEIKGILPIDEPTSFVAIDKVIVTLGPGLTQQNLLYTLLPDDWCETMGVHFHS